MRALENVLNRGRILSLLMQNFILEVTLKMLQLSDWIRVFFVSVFSMTLMMPVSFAKSKKKSTKKLVLPKDNKAPLFKVQMRVKGFNEKWILSELKDGQRVRFRRSAIKTPKVHNHYQVYEISMAEMNLAIYGK